MKTPMNFITLFISLTALCGQYNCSKLEDYIDIIFWEGIDEICQSVITEMHIAKVNTSYLRIIEYTKFGYRTHSLYPSGAESLMQSAFFEKDSPTVIFIHGFTDSPMLLPGRSIADAYKKHGRYNIVALDASALIKNLYLRSVKMAKYIGEILSVFLHQLTLNGVDPNKLHLIGHSLGAHIAGFAGKSYQSLKSGEKLPRITGLDPAHPCFWDTTAEHRLDSTDAHFVDIIHTNGGIKGLNISIGHVDFFPNGGGIQQPGCKDNSCSHARAWEFYEESVNKPENFIGVSCDSWDSFLKHKCTRNERSVMGFVTSITIRGNFYMKTRSFADFGLGDRGIE